MRDLDLFPALAHAAQNLARALVQLSDTDHLHGDYLILAHAPTTPPLPRRLPRAHDRRDGARQQSGDVGGRLRAARARRLARPDADRRDLSLLPLHRRRGDSALAADGGPSAP